MLFFLLALAALITMDFNRIKEETTYLRILQNNLQMTVFQRMSLFVSQSITQSEDKIYLIKKN